tara:strand:+ start:6625 stop:7050 length:426 start_codon:yes stop_codon:yes gene_type:complete
MFDFLKKNNAEKSENKRTFVEIACLLVHASKIDEAYTEKEKLIIKETLKQLGSDEKDLDLIIKEAENIEKDSNQILDFTKNLKQEDKETKYLIVESLWKIIFSDSMSDMYESNLMRRLTGLLYLSPKEVGDIKEKIKNNFK